MDKDKATLETTIRDAFDTAADAMCDAETMVDQNRPAKVVSDAIEHAMGALADAGFAYAELKDTIRRNRGGEHPYDRDEYVPPEGTTYKPIPPAPPRGSYTGGLGWAFIFAVVIAIVLIVGFLFVMGSGGIYALAG
jgi:hypothetical protein